MLHETRQYGIPATLRGLVNNDMKTTTDAVLQLVKDGVTDGVQIDPTPVSYTHLDYFDQNGVLSKRFGLTAVPARITPAPSGERLNIETFPVK